MCPVSRILRFWYSVSDLQRIVVSQSAYVFLVIGLPCWCEVDVSCATRESGELWLPISRAFPDVPWQEGVYALDLMSWDCQQQDLPCHRAAYCLQGYYPNLLDTLVLVGQIPTFFQTTWESKLNLAFFAWGPWLWWGQWSLYAFQFSVWYGYEACYKHRLISIV